MPETHADDLEPSEHGRILKSLVTPRPIGWISTTSEDGVDNLAPFSCYSYASTSPPVLSFRCSPRDGGELKDSPRNAIETGEFVANLVTEDVLAEMDATAEGLPPTESEFEHVGVERAESATVSPPRVRDALANMECTLHDHVSVHDSVVVFGEVQYYHLSDAILGDDGKVAMEQVDTIGRLGGPYYTRSDPIPFERSL